MNGDEGAISIEVRDHLYLMGLNRPEKYNGYTPTMARQLAEAMTHLDENPALRVGVLFAHGQHTTAGLDLPKWTEKMATGREKEINAEGLVDVFALGRMCRKPIVTAVKGITFTVGIELAIAGDIVIAADNARFSQLEPKRGIHATGGATIRFVQRCGWGNAMYHLLTCDEFDAAEAYRIGLVQEVVAEGEELDRAVEIAEEIASCAPLAVQETKAASRRFLVHGFDATVAEMDGIQTMLSSTEDVQEGVRSFLERRPAQFKGR